jgi:hypothetical protein
MVMTGIEGYQRQSFISFEQTALPGGGTGLIAFSALELGRSWFVRVLHGQKIMRDGF